ncbi:MAG: YbdD/YjiX family protein [Dokdonella sp.]|nr:YbdD/YjiX family protein [Dokdonella sp.]MCB1573095.1 YbdD/YjiX family protein [Xanthomonadales bacterium]
MTLLMLRAWVPIFLTCWRKAVQMARRCIGVPDYETYVAHVRRHHPERSPMSYEAFFIERQNARYKGGGGRCC